MSLTYSNMQARAFDSYADLVTWAAAAENGEGGLNSIIQIVYVGGGSAGNWILFYD